MSSEPIAPIRDHFFKSSPQYAGAVGCLTVGSFVRAWRVLRRERRTPPMPFEQSGTGGVSVGAGNHSSFVRRHVCVGDQPSVSDNSRIDNLAPITGALHLVGEVIDFVTG